jgi:hypothetical protein
VRYDTAVTAEIEGYDDDPTDEFTLHARAVIHLWTPERHFLINKAQIVGVTES